MNRHERRASRAKGIDIGETVVKYDGRTHKFEIFVNTDESAEAVLMRIKEAAQGPKLAMVVAMGGELQPEDAKRVWEALIPIMDREAAKGGVA